VGQSVKVLLDTHVLLWWLEGASKLSRRARNIIQNQETTVLVSAVSAWEIAIKSEAGKLEAAPLLTDFSKELGLTETCLIACLSLRLRPRACRSLVRTSCLMTMVFGGSGEQ
jgi:PIN domain nuclease of toxin-antitoxin system